MACTVVIIPYSAGVSMGGMFQTGSNITPIAGVIVDAIVYKKAFLKKLFFLNLMRNKSNLSFIIFSFIPNRMLCGRTFFISANGNNQKQVEPI